MAKCSPHFTRGSNLKSVPKACSLNPGAIVLVVVGGAFRELFSLAIFPEWLFYAPARSLYFGGVSLE